MIKCSVCQDRKKNRVITKCYHMFCDQCVSLNLKVGDTCQLLIGQEKMHATALVISRLGLLFKLGLMVRGGEVR